MPGHAGRNRAGERGQYIERAMAGYSVQDSPSLPQ